MKKLQKSLLAFALIAVMVLTLAACGPKTPGDTTTEPPTGGGTTAPPTTEPAAENLEGIYFVDLSPANMPMVVYLHIYADNTFMLTNTDAADGPDKGKGTVAGLDGTYMLLYDTDSKTATFTIDKSGGATKLEFSTKLPYGTMNLGFDSANIVAEYLLADKSNLPVIGGTSNMAAQFAGKYGIDLTDHGMAMMVYLIVDEEGNFQLSNKHEDGDDKGKGVIDVAMGKLALVYDTGERLEFTYDNDTFTFAEKLPYAGKMKLGADGVEVKAEKLPADYKPPETTTGGGMPGTTAPATMPGTTAPATTAPATKPPATTAPATKPPATTAPPATEPPATTAPTTAPPATEPPATTAPAGGAIEITEGTYSFEAALSNPMMGNMTYTASVELKAGGVAVIKSNIVTGMGGSEQSYEGNYVVNGDKLDISFDKDGTIVTATGTATAEGIEFPDPAVFFVRSSFEKLLFVKE